jgi:uncharacterized integral membrane protein
VFYVVLLVLVLPGGALAVLVIENFALLSTATQLSFFIWHMPPLPMGLWLLISCLYGALMLYLLSILSALRERREIRMLRQRVAELEQAHVNVPVGPLQAYPPPIVPMPGISSGPLPPSPPQAQK